MKAPLTPVLQHFVRGGRGRAVGHDGDGEDAELVLFAALAYPYAGSKSGFVLLPHR